MLKIEITPIRRRYWWPHRIYMEALRGNYRCRHKWLPCCDVVANYRYRVDGREVDLVGKPVEAD